MGRNRPIVTTQSHERNIPNGFLYLLSYLIKYTILSAGLSWVAYYIWNSTVHDLFRLPEVSFLQMWGVFVLASIFVVALRGLEHIGINPNSSL